MEAARGALGEGGARGAARGTPSPEPFPSLSRQPPGKPPLRAQRTARPGAGRAVGGENATPRSSRVPSASEPAAGGRPQTAQVPAESRPGFPRAKPCGSWAGRVAPQAPLCAAGLAEDAQQDARGLWAPEPWASPRKENGPAVGSDRRRRAMQVGAEAEGGGRRTPAADSANLLQGRKRSLGERLYSEGCWVTRSQGPEGGGWGGLLQQEEWGDSREQSRGGGGGEQS